MGNKRNITTWAKRIWAWLSHAKLLWIAIAVVLGSFSLLGIFSTNEPFVRLVGLALQLSGIGTVLHGISKTRQFFGHPSFRSIAKKWLRTFPKLRIEGRNIVINAEAGHLNLVGYAATVTTTAANLTVEDRLGIIEKKLQTFDKRTEGLENKIEQSAREASEAIATERGAREKDVVELNKKLELTETSGIYISLMGLAWLVIGLVMSTASVELSHLF